MYIVVIDDEPKIRKGLERHLSMHIGWNVKTFENPESALEYLYMHEVDVVITDIRMPEMSGLDMIERLRKVNPKIAIIILSGYSRFDYAQRAIELGVRKYMTKPTDPEELTEVLEGIQEECLETAKDLKRKVLWPEECDGSNMNNLLVLKAMEYMNRNYSSRVTLKSVAEILYISPNYLSELFSKTTGVRFSDYLQQIRMEKAKILLKDVSYRISDITEMVGFTDSRYFSSSFKKVCGMTPKEYRNQYVNKKVNENKAVGIS